MPTLAELSDPNILENFCKEVAKQAMTPHQTSIDENGVKTTEELYDIIHKGKDIPFDYQLLIDISTNLNL